MLAGNISLDDKDQAFIERYAVNAYNINNDPKMGSPIAEMETAEMRKERLEQDVLLLKRLGGNSTKKGGGSS